MALGGKREGAGRKKGVPNKKTQVIEDLLESLNCEPLRILAAVANGEPLHARIGVGLPGKTAGGSEQDYDFVEMEVSPTLDQRIAAAKELCQYVYPKRKAVEHSGPNGQEIPVGLAVRFVKPE